MSLKKLFAYFITLFYYLILLPFFKNIFTVYSNEIGRILNNT